MLGTEAWQEREGFEEFPLDTIPCPLTRDQLREPYSLSCVDPVAVTGVASIFKKQQEAYHRFSKNPPLTYGRVGNPKSAKQSMTPLEDSTIQIRCQHINHFTGFCVKWLGAEANYSNIMDPIMVAKYVGYHQTKGHSNSTIKTFLSSLNSTIYFVTSHFCPSTPTWSVDYIDKTKAWFNNLQGSMAITPKTMIISTSASQHTLWEVWQVAKDRWQALKDKLQVGLAANCNPTTPYALCMCPPPHLGV